MIIHKRAVKYCPQAGKRLPQLVNRPGYKNTDNNMQINTNERYRDKYKYTSVADCPQAGTRLPQFVKRAGYKNLDNNKQIIADKIRAQIQIDTQVLQ